MRVGFPKRLLFFPPTLPVKQMNREPVYLSHPICAVSSVHEQPEGNKLACPSDREKCQREMGFHSWLLRFCAKPQGEIIQLNLPDAHASMMPPSLRGIVTYAPAAGKGCSEDLLYVHQTCILGTLKQTYIEIQSGMSSKLCYFIRLYQAP